MYEEQRIDTSDIDRAIEIKRNNALQQLYKEIVSEVELKVKSGQITNSKQGNGEVAKYVSFNAVNMPSFRQVFPFGRGQSICSSESPTFNRHAQEAITRLKQLCVDKKIEINTEHMQNVMLVRYYIEKEGMS